MAQGLRQQVVAVIKQKKLVIKIREKVGEAAGAVAREEDRTARIFWKLNSPSGL